MKTLEEDQFRTYKIQIIGFPKREQRKLPSKVERAAESYQIYLELK